MPAQLPKLLDQVRHQNRLLHMARSTEEVYTDWISDFLRFHKKQVGRWRHPKQLDDYEINRYLTYLAVSRNVSASTQNQALSALVFLYKKVLDREIRLHAVRARRLAIALIFWIWSERAF